MSNCRCSAHRVAVALCGMLATAAVAAAGPAEVQSNGSEFETGPVLAGALLARPPW